MNVLMLGWELPPHNSGGLGEACMGLTKALAKKNIHITFVLPKKVELDVQHMDVVFANIEDVDTIVHPAYTTKASLLHSIRAGKFPTDYVNGAYAYAQKIKSIVQKQKSDIIHSHDWMTYPAGIIAQGLTGKPFITHIHSTEYDRTGAKQVL
jgi:glycogen synthase